jgi:hypothetical protein
MRLELGTPFQTSLGFGPDWFKVNKTGNKAKVMHMSDRHFYIRNNINGRCIIGLYFVSPFSEGR